MRFTVLLFWCLLLSTNADAETKTVRFAVGEWAPFTSSSENPNEKISERLVIRAYESQGYKVVLSHYPWPRSLRLAKQGKYDGTFPWMYMPEREGIFLHSEKMFSQKVVFFSNKNVDFQWQTLPDIERFHIGTTQDFAATLVLDKAGIESTLEATELNNFEKLVKNRIDAYPAGLIRGKYLLKKHFTDEQVNRIKIGSKALIEDSMHILFSTNNKERSDHLSEVFSNGLRHIYASGEYDRIVFGASHPTTNNTSNPQ
ncbi:substrate-binding periplasmic protein [Vibrio bivalvicida]|uniref:Substrate-binding periplasmic protein n=1 Tax=Vibrio bivalvicida TaxID=1276888 RepID=A0ABV4MLQ1_9VIBR